MHQRKLFSGLDCLPGQLDLFPTDGTDDAKGESMHTATYSPEDNKLRLRHLMETTEAVDHEMVEERQRFTRLARDESRPRAVSAFNLFQTPEPLAARVAEIVGDLTRRTLEPSAGLGRLYRAIRARSGCHVTLVEQSAECCAKLYREIASDESARLVQGDFLACDAGRLGLFNSVLMNPPFKMGRDIKHILHALTLLAPGGRLVAICANGLRQRSAFLEAASEWHDLPDGSFRVSGTDVNAAIIVFEN